MSFLFDSVMDIELMLDNFNELLSRCTIEFTDDYVMILGQ